MMDHVIPSTEASSSRSHNVEDLNLSVAYCAHCGGRFLTPSQWNAPPCPACFSSRLTVSVDPISVEPLELALPFNLHPAGMGKLFSDWLKGVWLPAADLTAANLSGRLAPCYLPMRLVDGSVSGSWCAQIGFDYQVASSHDSFQNNTWKSQQTTETRIRWEPRLGLIDRPYQNLAVAALESHQKLIDGLGGFDVQNAKPADPQVINKVATRLPDLPIEKSWSLAQTAFQRACQADCLAASGGQHIEQYSVQASYQAINWTLLLLPVYASWYQDDHGQVIPIWVHGQTGQIMGVRQASQKRAWKWTGLIALGSLITFVIGLLLSLGAAISPPAVTVGGILVLLAVVLALAAPVPALWAWQFNKRMGER